jgi:hypothetical protein
MSEWREEITYVWHLQPDSECGIGGGLWYTMYRDMPIRQIVEVAGFDPCPLPDHYGEFGDGFPSVWHCI